MSNYITKLIPYQGFETHALEEWFEDIAKKGLLLESITLCFARFKKVEPCNTRFRIDPPQGSNLKVNEARRLQLQELGWEYVTQLHGSLYKTDDPYLELPLVSDKASKINPLLQVLGAISLLLVFALIIVKPHLDGTASFHMDWIELIKSSGLYLMLSRIFLALAILVSLFSWGISSIQLHHVAKQGLSPHHTFHTEQRAKRCTFVKGLGVAFYCSVFLFLGLATLSNSVHDIPLTDYNGSIPFPLLEEINREEWNHLSSNLQSGHPEAMVENYLMKDSSLLAPDILMTRQYGPPVQGKDGTYRSNHAYTVNYYKLVSEGFAKKLSSAISDELPYQPTASRIGVQAKYLRNADEQNLLLQYNNIVITVWYSGSTDLRDCIPLYEVYFN